MDTSTTSFKSGMVSLVGPPNAGKSTLMNQLLGQKISIVTPKPQTTRNRILGVVNGENSQLVLLDTPGLHTARVPLNQEMVRVALESLGEVDLVVLMIDAAQSLPQSVAEKQNKELAAHFRHVKCPVVLVLNKVDLIDRRTLLPMMQKYAELFATDAILPLSALTGEGTEQLLATLVARMPVGPRYFPDDIPTDATERFLAGELIREKIFLITGQEIPYATAVVIESFQEDVVQRRVTIHATIIVERPSQKGIIIGKQGKKLKTIGTMARRDIEKMLGERVLLKLWVKVKKKWSQDERFLRELGY